MKLSIAAGGMSLLMLALAGCAGTPAAEAPPPALTLQQAIASPARTAAYRTRDRYRHPLETLQFFGVQPDMDVVEVWPAPGWYTEILAPYLRDRGRYTAAGFVVTSVQVPDWRKQDMAEYAAKLAAAPKLYDRVTVTEAGAPDHWEIAPPASADRVLTFRNVHNCISGDYATLMFDAMFNALKPGGILGVCEHRADPGTTLEQMKKTGYVTEAYVIQLAEQAGFKLQAQSEINANPLDHHDHPEGVWTLPPTLRLGDQDRAKYLAIGESDRMTLRFVKPMKIAPSGRIEGG
ncbi:MAG: class I SAM-dependent methyltransferase [Stenotrophobium sp.]